MNDATKRRTEKDDTAKWFVEPFDHLLPGYWHGPKLLCGQEWLWASGAPVYAVEVAPTSASEL